MLSDGEDYGDFPDDEDLEQVLTQADSARSRSFNQSSPFEDDGQAEDDMGLLAAPNYTGLGKRTIRESKRLEQELLAQQEAAEKRKKAKYKIHVSKDATHLPHQIIDSTQPGEPSSSPAYRARGPIWKKPKEHRKMEPPKTAPKAKTPMIKNYFAPQKPTAPIEQQKKLATPRKSSAEGVLDKSTVDLLSDDEDTFDPAPHPVWNTRQVTDEINLDDIPDDFFSSSSPVDPSKVPQRLVTPQSGFKQTTLFGGRASQAEVPASQVGKVRNYRADRVPETPTHHVLNLDALKTWVYPTNLGSIRDYQYSIVKNGLFNNVLVALPTGLGKTFIAATIMLNYYRWTKDAKIVFMAPTKPLVAQQIDACFNIAGIPRSETTMLTGEITPALRAEEWEEKRVFFMTPQTLDNDLRTGIADPKKIVLLVIDEAHRASGNYSYVKVVEFLRRFSTSFRVLALTATPGSSVEAVQEVIDNLEISEVEIRTEGSIDIQPFTHKTDTEQILLDPSEEMIRIQDLYSKALQPLVNVVAGQTTYFNRDPMSLSAFGVMKARSGWFMSDAGRNASMGMKGMMNSVFSILASLGHGVKLLNFHGIACFYETVKEFQNGVVEKGSKAGKYRKQINDSPDFKKMMDLIRVWINREGFVGHPKLIYLCDTVLNHFLDAGEGRRADNAPPSETRVIVFAEFRDSAEEIARTLNKQGGMIRASVFVGQADSKRSQGMNQAKQIDVIQKFKTGVFNIIVATSIGEEGLDIGQVDLIVCYDSSSSPIRMLQRMGRTGRKRAGRVVLTLMKGKEEDSWKKALDNYEKMQRMISSGERFAYRHDLSTRIIPRDIIPVVDKRNVEIPKENIIDSSLPEPRRRPKTKKRPPKKFNMPDGIVTGFQKASKLGKGLKSPAKDTEAARFDELAEGQLLHIPALEDVLLGPKENSELEDLYLNIPTDETEEVGFPDLCKFPDHQQVLRPAKRVSHGRGSRGFVRMVKAMNSMTDTKIERWRKLYEKEGPVEAEGIPLQTIVPEEDASETAPDRLSPPRRTTKPKRKAVSKLKPTAKSKPASTIVSDDEATETASDIPSQPPLPQRTSKAKSKAAPTSKAAAKPKPAKTSRAFVLTQASMSGEDSEDADEDLDADLSDFIVGDEENVYANATQARSSSPAPKSRPKRFFELTQSTATQDSDEDMPDVNELFTQRATQRARKNSREDLELESESAVVEKPRGKRRRVVEDSDDE